LAQNFRTKKAARKMLVKFTPAARNSAPQYLLEVKVNNRQTFASGKFRQTTSMIFLALLENIPCVNINSSKKREKTTER
jgi:hypothetical protein